MNDFNLMKTVSLLIAAICYLILGASPSYPNEDCIDSLPEDSFSFGYTLAAQGGYLVVGDPHANHVIIYTCNRDDKWLRTRKILPPKNSTAYKVGSGFGHTIALDGDTLIIGTLTVIQPEHNEEVNSTDFQEDNGFFSTSTVLYQTRLDQETKVKRIDLPDIPTKGAISNNMVVAEQGKIGFIFSQKQPGKRINQVYLLSDGKVHELPSSELTYRYPSDSSGFGVYGTNIALKNDLLVVSIDRDQDSGGVWLFDLNSQQNKPQKIALPLVAPAQVSVAISERFIAISNSSLSSSRYVPNLFDTTLIRNIATGATKIISGAGVSLDGNILARMRSIPDSRQEYKSVNEIPGILEVFKLEDDATPRLIQKQRDIKRGFVKNGLLITEKETASGRRICTKKIHEAVN
ncbi:MAG: hypothetical protein AAGE84_30690 [Cyanobacteria bacterium P01_G01_bin.39]